MYMKKGFTLLEVLVVVLIVVIITLIAVPSYNKSQDKNRYLAASGVLVELGNGVRMALEDYPGLEISSQKVQGSFTSLSENQALSSPQAQDFVNWMFTHKYITQIPWESGNTYMGYSFYVSTKGNANCGTDCKKTGAIACMNGSNLNEKYRCAWIDQSGNLLHD